MDILALNSHRKKRAWIDLLLITLASMITWVVAGSLDLAERWINWATLGEHYQLDEIIFVLLVACLGLMWFGKRRFEELENVLSEKMEIQSSLEKKHHEISLLLKQNRALIKHITFLREAERNQLAGELHDVFGQYLAAIDVNVSVGLQKTPENHSLYKTLQTIRESTDFLRGVTRSKLSSIKPPGLERVGLTASIKDLIAKWLESFPAYTVKDHITLDDDSIDYDTSLTFYRCLQESLVNISRHADASIIILKMKMLDGEQGREVMLSIKDNGKGFQTDELLGNGMGLIGMRERVTSLNGTFLLDSAPNKGTTITITIPLIRTNNISEE